MKSLGVLCCVIKDFIAKEWVGTRIDKEKAVFLFFNGILNRETTTI